MRIISSILLLLFFFQTEARTLRVLAIGNSFSEDAVEQYLYELALAQGDTLIIGNAYIGGCSIDRHWNNSQTGKTDYAYRKIVDGVKTNIKPIDLATIVGDEPWDIISLQQASPLSGDTASFGNLQNLWNFVCEKSTNANMEIVWHLTWAYPQSSKSNSFARYGRSQQRMYKDIIATARYELPKVGIERVVPTGRTIQRGRRVVGDVLNRDDIHLSLTAGRYAAACTWCEFLTRRCVVGNSFRPRSVGDATALKLQSAAHKAMMNDALCPDDTLRVLWVGNTRLIDDRLVNMVGRLADSQGVKLSMRRVNVGPAESYMNSNALSSTLAEGGWDFVVMQDRNSDVEALATLYSPDVEVVSVMTWKHHGNVLPLGYPFSNDYGHLPDKLSNKKYVGIAAPVGKAWKKVRTERPTYTLFHNKERSITNIGYYLTANVIFATLYKKPFRSPYTAGLKTNIAYYLQQTAQSITAAAL